MSSESESYKKVIDGQIDFLYEYMGMREDDIVSADNEAERAVAYGSAIAYAKSLLSLQEELIRHYKRQEEQADE